MRTLFTVVFIAALFYTTYFFWHDVLDFKWLSLPLALFSTWALITGGTGRD
jgi:hypothetical protein